ncbi:choice-of-anchor B family protein [Candidatus Palauibacter sp.]|uniref:choice-of-anchor B family protein n=1 Tax=Candidatus Palauibacter sp. TaxID=3101350 RepID=UPI003AF1FD92
MLSKRPFRFPAPAVVCAAALSCGESPAEPAPPAPQATSVSIRPSTIQLSALGETLQLAADVRDQSGRAIPGAQVAWSSSDSAVATVGAAGLVTAVGNGAAEVTASSGEASANVPVSVRQAAATAVISPGQINLAALGDTARLSATVLDARGNVVRDANVGWSSSDPAIAAVDSTGLVAAVGNGEATVTATSGQAEAAIPVSIRQEAASAAISPDPLSLEAPGDTARLAATVRDALDHTIQGAEVAWSSSDSAVAKVDPTGLVTAIGKGEATVAATSGPANATVSVSVRQSAHTVACVDGRAGFYPCEGLDLLGRLTVGALRPGSYPHDLNDVWGWTDPVTGTEYALAGRTDGLAIVDLSDPWDPQPLAFLPSPTDPSRWRDVKVYADHAYIVADNALEHGVQILDLTRLRDLSEFTELQPDGRYTRVSSVHNIAINEETGFAYAVGSRDGGETCGGGLHMIDLSNPKMPAFAGCHATRGTGWRGGGYTHDVQCVTYHGPDAAYAGREICVGSNETKIVVSDVTDKTDPTTVSTADYPHASYVHQGWLDEEHRFFYQNDELDEYYGLVPNSRMLVWDLTDLDDPVLAGEHYGPNKAIDHNIYVRDDLLYSSNYNFGIRILDITTRESPVQLAFFDTVPGTNAADFGGSWSNYPYFESGLLIVTSEAEGLFVLRLQR